MAADRIQPAGDGGTPIPPPAKSWLIGLAGAAAVVWLVLVLVQAIGSVVDEVGRAYDGVSLSPATTSEGVVWGCLGLYVAVVAYLFSHVHGVSDSRWERVTIAVVAVVFLALPPIALLLHVPTTADGFMAQGACGSWLDPDSQSTPAGIAYAYTNEQCAAHFADASRFALTVVAGGLVTPLVLMAYAILRKRPQPAQG